MSDQFCPLSVTIKFIQTAFSTMLTKENAVFAENKKEDGGADGSKVQMIRALCSAGKFIFVTTPSRPILQL